MSSEFNFTEIHDALTKQFNLDEMRTLCAKLGVPYEEVGSPGTPTGNARELIYWLNRRGRLRELEPFIVGVKVLGRCGGTFDPNTRPATVNSPAKVDQTGEGTGKPPRKPRGKVERSAPKISHAPRPNKGGGASGETPASGAEGRAGGATGTRRVAPGRSSPAKAGWPKLLAAGLLGFSLLAFFIWAFIYAPEHLPAYKQRILSIVSALLCGLFTFFLTGAIGVRGEASRTPLGLSLKATGGVAVFTLVLLWWLTPFAPVAAGENTGGSTPPEMKRDSPSAHDETHKKLMTIPLAPLIIPSRVNSVTLDGVGGRAVVAGEDGAVRVWRPGSQSSSQELPRRAKRLGARSVALAADGETVAAGYGDGKVCLWRKGQPSPPEEVQSHSWLVYEVYLSRDGRRLVTTGDDGGKVLSVRSWKIGDRIELVKTFKTPNIGDVILAVSSDLHAVALYSLRHRSVELWSIPEEKLMASLESSDLAISERGAGAFSEDGRLFAAGIGSGAVVLWQASDGKRLREFKGPGSEVISVALHPTGQMAAAGYTDGTVYLWDVAENLSTSMKEDEENVHALAFGGDGRVLASGGDGGKVQLWEVRLNP
ncbi:MAG TPA: hypothetical protein VF708_13060 [Pyrinomonadaceae bacterium]|jgi:WD40 repeat protein